MDRLPVTGPPGVRPGHLRLTDARVDGAAVYRAIERQPPPRPVVVFISGYADVGPYEEFLRTAQVLVLGKPFDIDALREMVRQMLGGA